IVNTTIGAAGLTFHSISANGAASGIVLNNTGASGGLTITGNGNTAVGGDNSGGIIQNTTSHGIALTSTLNPSFTNVKVQNTAGSGIKGVSVSGGSHVNGFTFHNGTIDNSGTGGGVDESNIAFNTVPSANEVNLTGAVSITNNTLTNSRYHGVDIQQYGAA